MGREFDTPGLGDIDIITISFKPKVKSFYYVKIMIIKQQETGNIYNDNWKLNVVKLFFALQMIPDWWLNIHILLVLP